MLPDQFLKCLADAECSVKSWDAASSELKLAIEKDIGPESGLLVLTGVSFVHLPPRFTIFAATSSKAEVPDFPGVRPEDNEWLYVFQDSWHRAHYLLAEDARYQLLAECDG
jgi:hypothetical protein